MQRRFRKFRVAKHLLILRKGVRVAGDAAASGSLGEIGLKKKKSTPRAKAKTASSKKRATGSSDAALRQHLVDFLKGGSAHVHFMDALEEFPPNKRGTFAQGLPHTGWQLLEHSRIAQWHLLEFTRNPKHDSPGFPEGYCPKTPNP